MRATAVMTVALALGACSVNLPELPLPQRTTHPTTTTDPCAAIIKAADDQMARVGRGPGPMCEQEADEFVILSHMIVNDPQCFHPRVVAQAQSVLEEARKR